MTWMGLDTIFGVDAWHRFGIDWGAGVSTPPNQTTFVDAMSAAGFDVTISYNIKSFFAGSVKPRLTGLKGRDFYSAAMPFSPSSIAIEGDPSPLPDFSHEIGKKLQEVKDNLVKEVAKEAAFSWGPIILGVVAVGVAVYFGMKAKK